MNDKSMDKRTEILEAARNRMMQYGAQKTTMQEIAQDVGMAVGTLYLRFKNKEEIVLALAEECRESQIRFAEEIIGSQLPPQEKIRKFMRDRFQFVREHRENTPHGKEFVRIFIELNPEKMTADWRQRFEASIVRLLEEGCQQGVFYINDPVEEASIFFMATQCFYPLPYLELPVWPEERELCKVIDWFICHWEKQPFAVNTDNRHLKASKMIVKAGAR